MIWMDYYYAGLRYNPNDLYHHGIKGQRWGVRRFQNPDGTLTTAGKQRYNVGDTLKRGSSIVQNKLFKTGQTIKSTAKSAVDKINSNPRLKTGLKVGAALAGAALVTYGAYKLNDAHPELIASGSQAIKGLFSKKRSAGSNSDNTSWTDVTEADDLINKYSKEGFQNIERKYSGQFGTQKNTEFESKVDSLTEHFRKQAEAFESRHQERLKDIESNMEENHRIINDAHKQMSDRVEKAYEYYKDLQKQERKKKRDK